jgi:hypothetical protein
MSTYIQWLGQSPTLPSLQEFRKMTPAQVNQYATRFSAATRAELLRQGLAALPSCWGRRAESCAGNADGPYLDEPQCSAIMGGYFGNFDKMDDATVPVPLCEESGAVSSIVPAAVLAAVVGIIFGYAVAKR